MCLHPQVYSDGLLVTLASPDFSMPYNVICLTSTVLAVFLGATANTLIKRTRTKPDKLGAARARKTKILQAVALVVVFAGLAVYLDEGVREQLQPVLSCLRTAFGLQVQAES